MRKTIGLILMAMPAMACAVEEAPDTTSLHEVTVTAIKYAPSLALQPLSSTTVSEQAIERLNINGMKQVTELAPNFFMPDYGSRMTSSIYVRGIGARIDQPAVGLNVDNIPVLNKNDYDFDMFNIERIEVMMGPQSVLYGRNAMAGMVNIYTLSPLKYQGLRMLLGTSSGNSWHVGAGIYHKFAPNFGIGFDLNAETTYGRYDNIWTREHYPQQKRKSDQGEQYAGRLKLAWEPAANVTVDNVLSYTFNRQGGYPYEWLETREINYNDTCYYNRHSVSEGLTVQWRQPGFTLSSITGLRYLDDEMHLDQDFTPDSYFTLRQTQKEWSLTQDIIMRGQKGIYKWMGGVFGFLKHNSMQAPVTFKKDGIQKLILDNMPSYLQAKWASDEFVLASNFVLPTWGLAAYHQSEVELGRWTLTGALRLDYEHAGMFYHNDASTALYVMGRRTDLEAHLHGHEKQHFLQLLPKFTATYRLPMREPSTVYASISKGYKAGGYNTQMFSDILQQELIPNMGGGQKPSYEVDEVTSYKPEYSWNYEVGGHISCAGGRVQTNLTAFYIDCRDQQLTVFPEGTTTGRMMTNAGRTRSAGAEVSIQATPTDRWNMRLSYGYTNAKFLRYKDGNEDYRGKYVPYAPSHTLFAAVNYRQPLPIWWFNAINFMVDTNGAGRIYWDEANEHRQNFYALMGASVKLELSKVSVDLWAENILNTKYTTFYFKSVGNSFVQRGKKRTLGITLRYIM